MYTPTSVYFDKSKYTLLIGVSKVSFDLSLLRAVAAENGFVEKDEFHITVIGFKTGMDVAKRMTAYTDGDRLRVEEEIAHLIDDTAWEFWPTSELRRLAKDYSFLDKKTRTQQTEHRESFIWLVDMPAMGTFYRSLNGILGTNFPTPPPHVTLFTKGSGEQSRMGIGVSSWEELDMLTSV